MTDASAADVSLADTSAPGASSTTVVPVEAIAPAVDNASTDTAPTDLSPASISPPDVLPTDSSSPDTPSAVAVPDETQTPAADGSELEQSDIAPKSNDGSGKQEAVGEAAATELVVADAPTDADPSEAVEKEDTRAEEDGEQPESNEAGEDTSPLHPSTAS